MIAPTRHTRQTDKVCCSRRCRGYCRRRNTHNGSRIAGVLGPCDTELQVDRNTDKLQEAIQRLHEHEMQWVKVTETLNEKFNLVAEELSDIRETQKQIHQEQVKFWNATQDTLNGLTDSVKTMVVCTEYLFTRSQINLLRSTITTRIQTILSAIQSYRVALWSYKATLLDALPNMARGYLPMSLVPRDPLIQILEEINTEQAHGTQHMTLALALDNLLRYYETPLIRRVESTEHGMLITIAIPLTTRAEVMDVFEAIPLPMPTDDNATATQWMPPAKYLAISQDHNYNALLTEEQVQACIGPDDAAICQRGFATARRRDSCLATLYYHTPDTALATCEMTTIQLPRIEQARNLGHGRWLILSRSDAFNFRLLPAGTGDSTPHGSISLLPGCRACILTLECGTKLESDNLHIKADAASCNATGARGFELEISTTLANLFSYVPLDKELPDLATLSAQRAHLFKEVQTRLPLPQDAPQAMSTEAFKTLTEPIAANIFGHRILPVETSAHLDTFVARSNGKRASTSSLIGCMDI